MHIKYEAPFFHKNDQILLKPKHNREKSELTGGKNNKTN